MSQKSQKDAALAVVIICVLIYAYGPLARAQYAYGDDYWLLLSDEESGAAYLSDGRPIFALAHSLIHRPIHAIGQLGCLRLITSFWVGIMSAFFFGLVRRWGGGRIECLGFAVALGTLPCLHTYVAQANFWLAPLAGAITMGATVLTYRATGASEKSIAHMGRRLVLPFALYLCTAAIYQPMLAWYWTVALVFLLDDRYLTCRDYRRRIHTVIALGLLFLCLYYVVFKLYFVLFGIAAKNRTQLTEDPINKLYWFLRIQLPLALNLWHLWVPEQRVLTLGIAAAVFAVIVAGHVVAGRQYLNTSGSSVDSQPIRTRRYLTVLRTLLVIFTGLLTHVHWLVIENVPQSYRVIAPLGAAVFLTLYWSLRQLSLLISCAKKRELINRNVAGGLALVSLVVCQFQAEKYWVAPQTTAYRFMLATIREDLPQDTTHLHLIRQGPADGLVADYLIESFGRPSSERGWTITAMVQNALKDSGVKNDIQTITSGTAGDPVPEAAGGVLVIDMRKVALYRMAD